MTNEEKKHFAQQLMDNPLLDEFCTKHMQGAIDRAANAAHNDDEARINALADYRAIRSFRSHCRSIANSNT